MSGKTKWTFNGSYPERCKSCARYNGETSLSKSPVDCDRCINFNHFVEKKSST